MPTGTASSKRAAQSKRAGRLRGIGIATYIEACGNNGPETATRARSTRDGGVTRADRLAVDRAGPCDRPMRSSIAEQLGLPPERVRMVQGDTDRIATGAGTGGSSSIPVGGAVASTAPPRRLASKLKDIAPPTRWKPSASDLEIADGAVRVAGTDRAISFADIAAHPSASPRSCAPRTHSAPSRRPIRMARTSPRSRSIPTPARPRSVNYIVVDDFGATLNPLLLAGQVHGGAVQGIGQALMESTVYDPGSGQLLSASFMDYAMPRADDAPDFVFETRNVPCKTNPLGVKGAGEAGAIGSCPAVMNAIVDALWRAHRIRHIDMPATPQRIWQAIRSARAFTAA